MSTHVSSNLITTVAGAQESPEVGAACRQDGAVSPEALASYHHHAITQVSMEALVVELLENKLEMSWKVHNKPVGFVIIYFCTYCFLSSALQLLLAMHQHSEGQCLQSCCLGTEFSFPHRIR